MTVSPYWAGVGVGVGVRYHVSDIMHKIIYAEWLWLVMIDSQMVTMLYDIVHNLLHQLSIFLRSMVACIGTTPHILFHRTKICSTWWQLWYCIRCYVTQRFGHPMIQVWYSSNDLFLTIWQHKGYPKLVMIPRYYQKTMVVSCSQNTYRNKIYK